MHAPKRDGVSLAVCQNESKIDETTLLHTHAHLLTAVLLQMGSHRARRTDDTVKACFFVRLHSASLVVFFAALFRSCRASSVFPQMLYPLS